MSRHKITQDGLKRRKKLINHQTNALLEFGSFFY